MKPLVLLVEDDTEIRLALGEVLETCGYQVALARHGRDALDQLRRGLRPGAILLDVMMPVMDGRAFRAAQSADSALAGIPVILLTATGQAQETGRELRTYAALSKPFMIADLLALLEQVCGGSSPLLASA